MTLPRQNENCGDSASPVDRGTLRPYTVTRKEGRKTKRWISRTRTRATKLTRRVGALLIALRNPATPWYAKAVGILVAAYAVSPIDLIPDFIPVLGLLDDLILLPLGIMLTIRMIPRAVFLSALRRSWKQNQVKDQGLRRVGVFGVLFVWVCCAVILIRLIWH